MIARSNKCYTLNRLASRIGRQPATKNYLDYIRSPLWRQIRLAHIEHAQGICEVCGWRKAVQVHHWHYRMKFGQERPEDLCAVCLNCHWELHAILIPDASNDNEQFSLIFSEDEDKVA